MVRHSIAKITNYTGFIGLRIGYDDKVRNQNRLFRVETIELLKIDHKYSDAGVNLPVEATIINIEKTNAKCLKIHVNTDF